MLAQILISVHYGTALIGDFPYGNSQSVADKIPSEISLNLRSLRLGPPSPATARATPKFDPPKFINLQNAQI